MINMLKENNMRITYNFITLMICTISFSNILSHDIKGADPKSTPVDITKLNLL